jgi:hypothetical protein
MLINKDPANAHEIEVQLSASGKGEPVRFRGAVRTVNFGMEQYVWHPSGPTSYADPAGPAKVESFTWKEGQKILLPKASVTVIRGEIANQASR